MKPPLLQVSGLAKAFDANRVLHDLQFAIAPGEIVGLLGPNGSGKSTLLNIVSGFERPDAGDIRLDGRSIAALPTDRIVALGMVRTFQLPAMPQKMSVLEVAMAAATGEHGVLATLLRSPAARRAERQGHDKAVELLAALLLAPVSHLPAAALSGGQKKLLGIVCALMAGPRLLMLDEPTAGVHPDLRRDIVQALQGLHARGMTLVIVEHDMHFIRELCTRCIVLDQGRIVASCRPDELASNERVVQAYLGASAKETGR
ncbi:ABC transporter ATP-binding protein [Verminephrobacter eiseniae]|uniref:ABC transporter ATP-binding protein n=1 Tax=Verminephrobacter eiseniae TaxID=364317 RepID=UPI0022376550|nr:ATP-binding cassette domain-containing protein [Verminephrobacter eiseniae]MCW5238647.1 ATP-binding cassette domain-containing protein [Verminephrobacter eiseniae]